MARLIVSASASARPGYLNAGIYISVSDATSGEPVSGLGFQNFEIWLFAPALKFDISKIDEGRPGFYRMVIQLPNFQWTNVGFYSIEVIVNKQRRPEWDKGQVVADLSVLPSEQWVPR